MSRKIIGVTVGTPMNPSYLKDKLNPVTSVNGVEPDKNGNVEITIPDSGGNADLTGYATERFVREGYQPKGNYLTEVPEGYAKSDEIPTKVSQLQNDSGYLTEHQDISGKLDTNKLPEAINTALAQAKASGDFDGTPGEDGQRGTGLLPVTTAPSTYTTAVNGLTPAYRIALSKVKSEASVSEVYAGDTLRYSYYHYPVIYVDSSYVYCRTRVSIRGATGGTGAAGANGTDGKSAYQYALDGGYTGTEEEFAQKLAIDGYVVAQPEPPENTNVLWFDTDDNSEEEPEGGGSAPADWNAAEGEPGHVLNRTHYDYIGKIVEEVTFDFYESSEQTVPLTVPLCAGETYTVHWGSENYVLECVEFMGMTCLGNVSGFGGEDTGEPFMIVGIASNAMIISLTEGTTTKVSIDGKITVKIPEKYIPDSVKGYVIDVTPEEMATMSDNMVTMSQSYDPFIDYLYTGGKVSLALSDNDLYYIVSVENAVFAVNQETGEPGLGLICTLYVGVMKKEITFKFNGTKVPPVNGLM